MENQDEEEAHDNSQDINVIQLHLEQANEIDLPVATTPSENRTKYYRQTYRTAWENMPDFRGWLRGVHGEPTRAYCMYCQKTLHAHRLSLLKHTCTIRHQKAAQIHKIRKSKEHTSHSIGIQIVSVNSLAQGELNNDETDAIVEYGEEGEPEDDDQVEPDEYGDEEEDAVPMDSLSTELSKNYRQSISTPMASVKPPISTHVLDTSKGYPVAGLQVSLYKLIDGRWTYINEGVTNTDGRFSNFVERSDFTPGRYKLHFDVDRFFEAKKQDTLYPFIEIVFDCKMPLDHYHVPLLLSPFGYTTYRGS
ncbi:hypothetical protein FQA39_LY06537 [Lamprigera yunnana]|nr:hypothetical protein FQA39_LY06537 [Lamprigera yunnana]